MTKYTKVDITILERYLTQLSEFEKTLSKLPAKEKQEGMYIRIQTIVTELQKLFTQLDTNLQKIIEMCYFDKEKAFEWEEIADEILCSRSKTLRLRAIIIDKTARAIG